MIEFDENAYRLLILPMCIFRTLQVASKLFLYSLVRLTIDKPASISNGSFRSLIREIQIRWSEISLIPLSAFKRCLTRMCVVEMKFHELM